MARFEATAETPIHSAIRDCRIPPYSHLLVAVSGGPDSVALLHAVTAVAQEMDARWLVHAAHVDHRLRGAESDADIMFVRQLCDRLTVPLDVLTVDVTGRRGTHGGSLETVARELRYAALERYRVDRACSYLLTGHTADDLAETVVMRLLRGGGLEGLSGIRARRGAILRPFLAVRHETILRYLQEIGAGYRLDSSNLDESLTRNRIRRRLMPVLEQEAPQMVAAIARSSRSLQDDAALLRRETEDVLRSLAWRVPASWDAVTGAAIAATTSAEANHARAYSTSVWRTIHPALQRTTIRAVLAAHAPGFNADADLVEIVRDLFHHAGRREAQRQLHGNLRLCFSDQSFYLGRHHPPAPAAAPAGGSCPVPGSCHTPFGLLQAELVEPADQGDLPYLVAVAGSYHAFCPAGAITSPLEIRSRQPGDRLRPAGLDGTRKVQDVLVDRHIAAARRDSIPIIADEEGIIWIPGIIRDERLQWRGDEGPVLHLQFRPSSREGHDTMPRAF